MPQTVFQINIASAHYPFTEDTQGRTVVIPQQDINFDRTLPDGGEEFPSKGIPQAYYMHNVIATRYGFSSIAYNQLCTPPADSDGFFSSIFVLRDSNGNKAYLGVTSSGRNYVLTTYLSGWLRTTDVAPLTTKDSVTVAYVNGVTYIYFGRVGCYTYNFATNVLTPVVLTTLVANTILGIVAAAGYLIAYTSSQLAWSSTITPTDFTPSLISGAGGGPVQDLQGNIITCVQQKFGLMIYTAYNVVAGVYTGNARYPFNFRAVVASSGLSSAELVGYDPESGEQYAYTSSGLQLVAQQQAQTKFPEVTDFLSGSYFEDFDETTLTFSNAFLSSPMAKKLTVVADRYLILSYGITQLTHALVYDISLMRWGKLKITHVDCFEYLLFGTDQVDTPRKSVAFLQADGTITVANFATNGAYDSGVLLLGKYQLQRAAVTELHSVALENIRAGSNFTLYDMYSLDGKNTVAVEGYLMQSSGMFREYTFSSTGINHSLLLKGQFNLVSGTLRVSNGGYR